MASWDVVSSDSSSRRHIAQGSRMKRVWPYWLTLCNREGNWRAFQDSDENKPYCLHCLRRARAWTSELSIHIATAETVNKELEQ